jgi:hypothetical protein
MKIIFAINGSAIPNFVLEADSKQTFSKPHAIQQNAYIYLLSCCYLVFIVRETCLCYLSKVID